MTRAVLRAGRARRWVGLSVLALSSLRFSARHPVQLGLSVVGIALGVAVVIAIDISSESARRAFDLSTEAVLGRTTHQVVGGSSGVDETLYPRLRRALEGVPVAPIVEGPIAVASQPGRTLNMLGIDPFSDAPFRPHLTAERVSGGASLARLVTLPGAALLASQTARELGVSPGDVLAVRVGGRPAELEVVGVMSSADSLSGNALADLVVVDIATAQEVLGQYARISRLDLIVPEGEKEAETVRRVESMLPPAVRLVTARARTAAASEMTRAFRLNLVMLSLLALVVGTFLIYNTMTFSVIQRRALIGNLRALGVTRSQVFELILSEAVLLGLIGGLLGLGLGVGLSSELVKLVSRTINDLYFTLNVRDVAVPGWVITKGLLLGVGAAAIAAAVPALEATRVAPRVASTRSMIESRMLELAPRAALAGAALIAIAVAGLAVPSRALWIGFAALFGIVLGFSLCVPWATVMLVRGVRPIAAALGGSLGPLSVQGLSASLSRTAVAIAALTVALAATVGVGLMVDSFRRSVADWLTVTLQADIYISAPSSAGRRLDPSLVAGIEAVPGIAALSMGRTDTVESPDGPVEVVSIRMAPQSYRGFRVLQGDPVTAWPAFDDEDAVLVTEPFSFRHSTRPGDRVRLYTDRGAVDFTVAGVVRDYGSEQGSVIISRDTFERFWDDRGHSTLGVYLEPDADAPTMLTALRAVAGGIQDVFIRSNTAIREASLEVFDRTFTITLVLRMLATGVAFVGVLSALMALALERARELAVLRALGLTQAQVWAVVSTQTGLMGLIAGVLSIPLGLAMALVLIVVINRRSFGWSIDVHFDPAIAGTALLLALGASMLAGLYPTLKMTRTAPALALREE